MAGHGLRDGTGCISSHGLTEMLALRFLGDTGIRVLLRGHGGELAKATSLPGRCRPTGGCMRQRAWTSSRPILPRAPISSRRDLAARSGVVAVGRGEGRRRRASLHSAGCWPGRTLTPAEACSYLMLHELHPDE